MKNWLPPECGCPGVAFAGGRPTFLPAGTSAFGSVVKSHALPTPPPLDDVEVGVLVEVSGAAEDDEGAPPATGLPDVADPQADRTASRMTVATGIRIGSAGQHGLGDVHRKLGRAVRAAGRV